MNLLLIYGIGAGITTLFLAISFAVIVLNDNNVKLFWKDLGISILSIIGWPLFWIIFIASKIG